MHENVILEADLDNFIKVRKAYGSQEDVAGVVGLKNQQQISDIEVENRRVSNRTYTLLMLITNNHDSYKLIPKSKPPKSLLIEAPSSEQIKNFRQNLKEGKRKVTQGRMASLLQVGGKQAISKYETGARVPSVQAWTLWLLITDKHPHFKLEKSENN